MASTCCKYSVGSLRTAIRVQAESLTSDGQGGFSSSGWADVPGSPTRALLTAAPGNERWGYMRQIPGNVYKMVTQYFASASLSQRILVGTKEYAVLGVVDPDSTGRWLEWRLTDGMPS